VSITVAVGVLVVCFLVLLKCADWFVEGAVGLAEYFNAPKMLIGIVLVSLATTAPELAVSVLSALEGHPEMALGNAVGSVIVDDGVALALGILFASSPILVNRRILKTAGFFLAVVSIAAYALAHDGVLNRVEGGALVLMFIAYMVFVYYTRKTAAGDAPPQADELAEIEKAVEGRGLGSLAFWFMVGLAGVLASSEGIVSSAVVVAQFLGVSEAVIALTVVAVGTSMPEIATAVTAARRGHGEIMVGNILGADILNICWIAGASALVNPLVVDPRVIHFSFPAMFVIVGSMLFIMRTGYRLKRPEGIYMLALYAAYLLLMYHLFI
jgi:cation:H+ antiporter